MSGVFMDDIQVGTMAAALRAGVPQIPCPFMLDQPHNAKIIKNLGCALDVLPFSKLSAKKLSTIINQTHLNKNNVKNRATELGRRVREESDTAIEKYCALIEEQLYSR